MKKVLFFLLVLTASAFADGPEPDPWWKQVENWQSLAMKWIVALTVVVGAVASLAMLVIQKLNQIRTYVNDHTAATDARLTQQREDIQVAQAQVVDLAKQVSPPSTQAVVQTPPSNDK